MTLQNLEWQSFKSFLVVKCHYKDTESAMYSNVSRFNKIKNFFQNREFNEEGLLELLYLQKTGQYQNKILTMAKRIADYLKLDVLNDLQYMPIEPAPEKTIPTIDEILLLANCEYPHKGSHRWFLNTRDKAIIMLFAYAGPRPGEVCKLQWKDIKSENGRVYLVFRGTKKKKDIINRKVFIPKQLAELISVLPRKSEYVFCSYRRSKLRTQAINEMLKERAEYLGIHKNIYGHLLRHQFITTSLDFGVDWFRLSAIVGHRDPKTTRGYYDGSIKSQEDALKRHPLFKDSLEWKDIENWAFDLLLEFQGAPICNPTISVDNDTGQIILKIQRT